MFNNQKSIPNNAFNCVLLAISRGVLKLDKIGQIGQNWTKWTNLTKNSVFVRAYNLQNKPACK